jgi:hypothetical protein
MIRSMQYGRTRSIPHTELLSVWFGLILVFGSAPSVRCDDGYLVRFGPPPLRFSTPIVANKEFSWPVPLFPKASATNQTEVEASPGLLTNTFNSKPTQVVIPAAELTADPQVPEVPRDPHTFVYPNSSTASNLLLVSPQMLAEYLKANSDSGSSPMTNGFGGMEVPFSPPSPRITPSSEAIYRTQ